MTDDLSVTMGRKHFAELLRRLGVRLTPVGGEGSATMELCEQIAKHIYKYARENRTMLDAMAAPTAVQIMAMVQKWIDEQVEPKESFDDEEQSNGKFCVKEKPDQDADEGHDFIWCCGYGDGEGGHREKGFCKWCQLEVKEPCPGGRCGQPGCRSPELLCR